MRATCAEDDQGRTGRPPAAPVDLAARYDELQRRVTRFAVVEQELINLKANLDGELARFERLNLFTRRSLPLKAESDLAACAAEAVVDVLEVEIGAVWLVGDDGALDEVVQVGLEAPESELAALGEWLRSRHRGAAARILDLGETPLLRDTLGLAQAIGAASLDEEQRVVALLLGGTTVSQAAFFEPLTADRCLPFTLFAQQFAALRANLRTRALLEQQIGLRRAKEEAEQANRAKSSFLANMSHEIRTPINAIMGLAYLASKTALTDKQRGYVDRILGSTRHLLGIVNDVLDYSKIEAGKLAIESTSFFLDGVLDQVRGFTEERAARKGLALSFDVGPGVPNHLVGDPLRLAQILLNYTSNGVKFTERGSVAVRVHLEGTTPERVALRFSVTDTGVGIEPGQRAMLFQSFQQADNSTTRRFGGSGLGLAISRQLANLMGGEVGVESVAGRGSTFWFRVTFERGAAPWGLLNLKGSPGSKRALVVCPDRSEGPALARLLESLGMEPSTASSGAEAAVLMRRADERGTPYRFVFLTWELPPTDGAAWAAHLRTVHRGAAPELVLLADDVDGDSRLRARSAGVHHVLTKPLSASRLFDCLSVVLGSSTNFQRRDLIAVATSVDRLATIRGARILLVEDNELNQEVATEILTDIGLCVTLARHGQEAVTLATTQPFELVLMDMQMPVMDGLSATLALRAEARLANLPIVAMTANAMAAERAACFAAGMNDHVAKPIDPPALFRALLKWVPPRAQGSGPPSAPPSATPPSSAAAPQTQAESEGELPKVDGLDTAGALARMLGKRGLYLATLRRFLEGQRQSGARLREALATGDRDGARREAHTLKGLAASVGHGAVAVAAAELEEALVGGAPEAQVAELIEACEAQLQPLLAALGSALPSAPAAPSAGAQVTGEALSRVCRRLAALLAEDDADALQVLDEHRANIQGAGSDGCWMVSG